VNGSEVVGMTGAELMSVILFGLAVIGGLAGAFWRMWGLIDEAGDKGERAQHDLAAHKLHVAETYVTKAGMQEQTSAIMKAIDSVGDKIDRTNERLDRVFEQKSPSRRT